MDSPGPQQSQFDIFELTWTSRVRKGLLAPNSKICTFLTKPRNMGVYGLAWTPAIIIVVIWTLGPNFGPIGLLAPNSKICTFVTKPHNMGVCGLHWAPATFWEVTRTPGVQICTKGFLAPNSKICTFVTKPHNMGVCGLLWAPATFWGVTRTPGVQIWVQGPFGAKFKNLHSCHKTPQYGCLWTPLDLSSHNLTFLS